MGVSAATHHLLAGLALWLFWDAALAAGLPLSLPPPALQHTATAPDAAASNAPSAAAAPGSQQDALGAGTAGIAAVALSASPPSPTATENQGEGALTTNPTVSTVSAAVSTLPTTASNTTLWFHDALAQGELPLRPEITPGFSVAGVLLMLSGSAYALVGIKSRWLHCLISTAFLASLGVTVLLVYVMNPPVGKDLQGAYVAAAAGSGIILGSVSFIFQDFLECLACLLGGFCLCMWILTLKPGGLLGSGGDGNIVFITLLSAASVAAFFSRWTRTHFMIGCISLSGATAIVLGIDCFSRAGLKEFWAYIWGLNDSIFPLGVDTFPLTKGIRVEQAAIILICFSGIMSQLKVWRLIKERRARKDAARQEKEAELQKENLEAGRLIEDQNALERRDWDAVHGDPVPKAPSSVHTAQASSMGDAEIEKESVVSVTAREQATAIDHDQIGLDELRYDSARPSPTPSEYRTVAELVMAKDARGGIVTVQVAEDEDPEPPASPLLVRDVAEDTVPREDHGKISPMTASPEVVPLPFNVPEMHNDDDDAASKTDDDSSSILVHAEPDNDSQEQRTSRSRRSSIKKQSSTRSVNPVRRLSQNSIPDSQHLKTAARDIHMGHDDSALHLQGDRDSIAATFDNESSLNDHLTDCSDGDRRLSRVGATPQSGDEISDQDRKATASNSANTSAMVSVSGLDPVLVVSAIDWAGKEEQTSAPPTELVVPVAAEEDANMAGRCKSIRSDNDSPPMTLTKEHLPTALSKVALSYRTNEWAKHLSHAEAPVPEELMLSRRRLQSHQHTISEAAAPVNVKELRQTATNATPVPAMPRTSQAMSRSSTPRSTNGGRGAISSAHRSSSHLEITNLPKHISPLPSPILDPKRVASRNMSLAGQEASRVPLVRRESRQGVARTTAAGRPGNTPLLTSSAEMSGALPATTSTPTPVPAVSRPPVPGVVSYDSPQTLIGQRAILMRAKTHALNAETLRGSPVPSASPSPAPTPSHPSIHRRASDTYRRSSDTNAGGGGGYQVVSGRSSLSRVSSHGSMHGGRGAAAGGHETFKGMDSSKPPPAHRRTGNLPNLPPSVGPRQTYQPTRRRSSGAASSVAPQAGLSAMANYHYGPDGSNNNYSQQYRQQLLLQQMQQQQRTYQPAPPAVPHVASHLINSVYGIPGTSMNNSLLSHQTQVSDPEVGRNLELQRQYLMSQQIATATLKEAKLAQQQSRGQRFEVRMRTDSELLDAHRDALRRMQSRVV